MNKYTKPQVTNGLTFRDLREGGQIILAHGEVTGHSHKIVSIDSNESESMDTILDGEKFQYFQEPSCPENAYRNRRVLFVLEPCVLRHQEHAPIFLDPNNPQQVRQGDVLLNPIGLGAWEVIRQYEYTPQRIRRVAD